MKKTILAVLLLTTASCFAQVPHFTLGAYNKGVVLGAGITADVAQVSFEYTTPLWSNLNAATVAITAGPRINLSHYDSDNFYVAPMAGIGLYEYMHPHTLNDAGDRVKVKGSQFIYGAELGKQWHNGILFVFIRQQDQLIGGIGIKVLIQ